MIKKLNSQINILKILGLRQYIKYRFTRRGKKLILSIYNENILVRKGTPDLTVSLLTLGGEFDILSHIYSKDETGTIIDAGGYIGTAAIAMSKLYPLMKIISIEPSKDNFEILQTNIASHPNITALNCALVAKNRGQRLSSRSTGEWGYTVLDNTKDTIKVTSEIINIIEFQEILNYGEIKLLKMDIEGAETEIFNEASSEIHQIPAIFVELHERLVPGSIKAFNQVFVDYWKVLDSHEKWLCLSKHWAKHD